MAYNTSLYCTGEGVVRILRSCPHLISIFFVDALKKSTKKSIIDITEIKINIIDPNRYVINQWSALIKTRKKLKKINNNTVNVN